MKIIWDGQYGLTFPEGRLRAEMPQLIAQLKETGELRIGQQTIFNELRLAIKRRELNAVDCELIMPDDSQRIGFHPDGNPIWWPTHDGFDLWDVQLHEFIGL